MKNQHIVLFSNYLSLGGAICLIALFPFYYVHQHAGVLFFFIAYIIDFIIDKRWQHFRRDNVKWLYFAFIAFFLLIPIYHIFEKTDTYYLKSIEVYLPFFAFGIIGLFGYNKLFKLRYFAMTTVLVSFLIICTLIVNDIGIGHFLRANFETKMSLFTEVRLSHVNNHMIFNIYLNIALISVLYLLLSPERKKIPLFGKVLFVVMGVVIFSTLIISEGRTGFFTANMIILFAFFYYSWKWKKIVSVFLTISVIAISAYIITHHPRVEGNDIENETRIPIWEIALETAREHPILGQGISDARERFYENGINNEEFMKIDWFRDGFERKTSHPHNQFMQTIMSFGVLGLALLLFIFIFPVIASSKNYRIFIFLFVSIFAFQSMFEIFGVGNSVLMYVFYLTLFLQRKIPHTNQ